MGALALSSLLRGAGDASLADCDVGEDGRELLVLAEGSQDVVGDDALLALLVAVVARLPEDLCDDVLEDGREVDGRVGRDALCVATLAQVTVDAPDRERDPRARGPALHLAVVLDGLGAHGFLYLRGQFKLKLCLNLRSWTSLTNNTLLFIRSTTPAQRHPHATGEQGTVLDRRY